MTAARSTTAHGGPISDAVVPRVPRVAVFLHPHVPGCVTPPSVVVMQAIEDWECHGQTVCLGVEA